MLRGLLAIVLSIAVFCGASQALPPMIEFTLLEFAGDLKWDVEGLVTDPDTEVDKWFVHYGGGARYGFTTTDLNDMFAFQTEMFDDAQRDFIVLTIAPDGESALETVVVPEPAPSLLLALAVTAAASYLVRRK